MTREEKQKAIDALKISTPVMAMTQEEFNDYIQTLNQVMDWLEQEPSGDAVSRQVFDEIKELMTDINGDTVYAVKMSDIRQLPPVKPQEMTGHWILTSDYDYEYCTCSECGYQNGENWMIGSQIKFCQECGAKMLEPQERSEE